MTTPGPGAGAVAEQRLSVDIDGVEIDVAVTHRTGELAPILFLHGFGSTKEDYLDIAHHPAFADRPFIAYDAPGCGQSSCSDPSAVSIPFLVRTARAVLESMATHRYHLVGHSMGGLTGLLLARDTPDQVLSFVDIEGNLAPEDCFLSRQIITHPHLEPRAFLEDFTHRIRRSPAPSNALYAANLRAKVDPAVIRGIFESMVDLSDNGELLTTFLGLSCPRMFMYGRHNAELSYLPTLSANGITLAEIEHSAHFPMYANPTSMWQHIHHFHTSAGR